ncbi:MAG: hypothetical protein JWN98_1685, partial [Abditibacteriota bacterium]|nr:hypothetical protein [Abditibacteriota bacterium]
SVRRAAAEPLPPEGRALNDTGGRVPGQPENGIRDLQKIHQLMSIYKRRNGSYPQYRTALYRDIKSDPNAYGGSRWQDIWHELENPDIRFSDNPHDRKFATEKNMHIMPYTFNIKRPDGTPLGTAKPPGKRDVLSWTNLYVHQNIRQFKGERTTSNPVGFYLVLWDDGQVEKVPHDQILFVPTKPGTWITAFPNQAGVPSTALNYDQFHQRLGAKEGPRGTLGGKGVTYKGTTLP